MSVMVIKTNGEIYSISITNDSVKSFIKALDKVVSKANIIEESLRELHDDEELRPLYYILGEI